jgi:hypothetical protein
VGGADSIDVSQRFLLARSVLSAWGEPARPAFSPEVRIPLKVNAVPEGSRTRFRVDVER